MKKIGIVIVLMLLGIFMKGGVVEAGTPRVMISDYEIEEKEVIAGKEFTLKVTLNNTSGIWVKNLKLMISSENGELLPVEGAGTAYTSQIYAYSEETFTFKMKAAEGLEEKSYKLLLKTEYEGSYDTPYTVEETIFIPVKLEQRLSITDIYLQDSDIELGDSVEISAVINNLGAGTLRNVTAKIKGDNLEETESYVGNIESGKSGTLDALTNANGVTSAAKSTNQIIISYEDKEGHVYEKTADIAVRVSEPIYENLEKVKTQKDYSQVKQIILWGVLILFIVVALIWLIVAKRNHKKRILEEF